MKTQRGKNEMTLTPLALLAAQSEIRVGDGKNALQGNGNDTLRGDSTRRKRFNDPQWRIAA